VARRRTGSRRWTGGGSCPRATSTSWEDEEPVLALQVGDEHRAYPVQVLIWHEIVNDTVADVPVAVTYRPLCTPAIATSGGSATGS
jgi:hypothetical protein